MQPIQITPVKLKEAIKRGLSSESPEDRAPFRRLKSDESSSQGDISISYSESLEQSTLEVDSWDQALSIDYESGDEDRPQVNEEAEHLEAQNLENQPEVNREAEHLAVQNLENLEIENQNAANEGQDIREVVAVDNAPENLANDHELHGVVPPSALSAWDVEADTRSFGDRIELICHDKKMDLISEEHVVLIEYKIGIIKTVKNNLNFVKTTLTNEVNYISDRLKRVGTKNALGRKLKFKRDLFESDLKFLRKKVGYYYDELDRLFGVRKAVLNGDGPIYRPDAKAYKDRERKKRFVGIREEEKLRAKLIFRRGEREE